MAALDKSQIWKEHICSFRLAPKVVGELQEAHGDNLPSAIFPQVRIITANKITKNKTFYPESSLRGNLSEGTGLASFMRPYPIPFILDHNTHGSPFGGGGSSPVFGRIAEMPRFVSEGGVGYVQGIFRITHPKAVRAILAGEWMTVSLGSRTESVQCSICMKELTNELCDHEKGGIYKDDDDGQEREAFWIIGPISAKETSAVVVPSDDEAGVQNPNLYDPQESLGGVERIISTGRTGVWDLMSGAQLAESYTPRYYSLPAQRRNFSFRGY